MAAEITNPKYDFKVSVVTFCPCGWLMIDGEVGSYCENPDCEMRTKLFQISVNLQEIPVPKGAVA